jgi:glycosyltransferase involved in cell wall biosynthesis
MVGVEKPAIDGTVVIGGCQEEANRSSWLDSSFEPNLASVIVPTYNRAQLVVHTLRSLLLQTYRPIEIIIVDDGSTDETPETLREFQIRTRSESGVFVQILTKQNEGAPIARNLGAQRSNGEFVAFLDSDDIFAPAKLSLQVAALNHNPDWQFCYGPVAAIEEPDKPYYGYRALDWKEAAIRQLQWPFFSTLGPLIRREFLNSVGPWCEDLQRCQDWELHSRMVMQMPQFGWVPNAWAHFRREGNSATRESKQKPRGAKYWNRRDLRSRATQIHSAIAHAPADLRNDKKFRETLSWEIVRLARSHAALGLENDCRKLLRESTNWSRGTLLHPYMQSVEMIFQSAGARPTVLSVSLSEWLVYRIYAVYLRVKCLRETVVRVTSF